MKRLLGNWVFAGLFAAVGIFGLSGCDDFEQRKTSYLEKGKEFFDAGEYDRAWLELKNVLQIDEKHAESWYLLGRIKERASELPKALANYTRAVELDANLVDARIHKARILIAAKRLDVAQEDVDIALQQAPRNPDALVNRGMLRLQREDKKSAEEDARAALLLDRANVGAIVLLAGILEERNDLSEAVALLRKGIELNPNDLALKLMLVRVYDTSKNTDGVIEVLRQLVKQWPKENAFPLQLANVYLKMARAKDAEEVLRDAIAVEPDDIERQKVLLRFLVQAEGIDSGRKELENLKKRQPELMELRFIEAEMQRAAKENAGAEETYRQIIDKSTGKGIDAIRARNALASMMIMTERKDEAKALVKLVLDEAPGNADALQMRAVLAVADQNVEQAIADLRRVLRDYPERLSAQHLLGQAHAVREEYDLAEEAFLRAIELNPNDPVAYLQLSEVRVRIGDSQGALTVLDQLLEKIPENAAAQLAIARIRFSAQDWGALAETADRIRETRPDHPLGYYLAGSALQRQGQHEEAIAAFEKALEIRPDAVEPLVALARSQMALSNSPAAERRVRQVLERSPNSLVAINLLGDIQVSAGNTKGAIETYKEAARFHPKSPRAYERLAELYFSAGDLTAARQVLERGVEHTARNGFLLFRLAGALQLSGEKALAIAAYEDVVARYPNAHVPANNLALLLVEEPSDPAAVNRALELVSQFKDTKDPALLDTLGWVHHKHGDDIKALPYLEEAVSLKPEIAEHRYHLGIVYQALGRAGEAKQELNQAMTESKNAPWVEQARLALKALNRNS